MYTISDTVFWHNISCPFTYVVICFVVLAPETTLSIRSFYWIGFQTLRAEWIAPCESVWKTLLENGVRSCVHFCLRSLTFGKMCGENVSFRSWKNLPYKAHLCKAPPRISWEFHRCPGLRLCSGIVGVSFPASVVAVAASPPRDLISTGWNLCREILQNMANNEFHIL